MGLFYELKFAPAFKKCFRPFTIFVYYTISMKKKISFLSLLISVFCFGQQNSSSQNLNTTFESSNGLKTGTYEEVIAFYLAMEKIFPAIKVYEMGQTDSGFPLHLIIFDPENKSRKKTSETFSKDDRNLLLINNGIHPGEPDGIDATMLLFRDFAENKIPVPKHTIIATIPIYNIGGALNRNSNSRTRIKRRR